MNVCEHAFRKKATTEESAEMHETLGRDEAQWRRWISTILELLE